VPLPETRAFDLIELNGDDLRRDPLEGRKVTLEMILAKAEGGVRFNEHMVATAKPYFAMHASSALKALSRSGRKSSPPTVTMRAT